MYQILYVLVYPSRPFAAHWSFWLPHLDQNDQESIIGDRIHITGDRFNGFEYEYVRDYNVREDSKKPTAHPVGSILASHLSGTGVDRNSTSGGIPKTYSENNYLNLFDETCREVPPPGPSLNKITDISKTAAPPRRTEVKDCQWWIKQAVYHLVETGILLRLDQGLQAEDPIATVDSLPRHG